MQSVTYKLTEFFLIFIVLPLSFAFHYPFFLKAFLAVSGFAYVIYILVKVEGNAFKIAPDLKWKPFWMSVCFKLVGIAILTIAYLLIYDQSELFHVLYKKPQLWVFVLFAYAMFSVFPQELIYRTLYFQRYACLFKSKTLFILLNAILFSMAHLFYKNVLVLFITFLGGLLFAFTYYKTKSTLLVTIEHAIYGCWLYTVGMGHMLGFPE